ncbi:hypothetical protein WJX73_007347 [Symbiochloris irregularis]|uniref:C3H1-type domain-containing protein n=1 Tax=Symbiochloris irregularis TaxID=706552 RepID=A0AAW1NS19_9CHLO
MFRALDFCLINNWKVNLCQSKYIHKADLCPRYHDKIEKATTRLDRPWTFEPYFCNELYFELSFCLLGKWCLCAHSEAESCAKREMHQEIVDDIEASPDWECPQPSALNRATLNIWIIAKVLANDLLARDQPEHVRHMQLLLIEALVLSWKFFQHDCPGLDPNRWEIKCIPKVRMGPWLKELVAVCCYGPLERRDRIERLQRQSRLLAGAPEARHDRPTGTQQKPTQMETAFS